MKRCNIGAGSVQPADWFNFDANIYESGNMWWDVRDAITGAYFTDHFDYAVCSFMLQCLDHHELPGALVHIRQVLRPGGILRVLVPEITRAIEAYHRGDQDWFPQDERTGGIDAKFCTYVTWYGTSKSVFTPVYLTDLLNAAGFASVTNVRFGETTGEDPEICSLDSRQNEALIYEAVK